MREGDVALTELESRQKPRIDPVRRAEIGREKRNRTRTAILNAAFDLIGNDHGTSIPIETICAGAGVSRATFYTYFKGVSELIEALGYELSHEFNTAVSKVLSEMTTASERVSAATRYYLQKAVDDPKWGWAMVHISAGGPIFGADTYARANSDVEYGIMKGEFLLPGPNSGRDLILGTGLAAMITQLRDSPSPTFPASIARHCLLGLGVSRARSDEIVARPLPPLPVPRTDETSETT